MNNTSKGIFKKTIVAVLSMTMALGALSLPCEKGGNSFSVAYAENIFINDCIFSYKIETDRDVDTLVITGVKDHGETVEIPSVITYQGKEYPVSVIDTYFLEDDISVKTVIFPESVKYIRAKAMANSSVENIVLPDGLERIDDGFAKNCSELRSVKYNGTNIKGDDMGSDIFKNSDVSALTNEKGAVILGNWLISCTMNKDATSVRIADFAGEGQKIENIGHDVFVSYEDLTTLDLEGIKTISNNNFYGSKKISSIINDDDIENIFNTNLNETAWYKNAKGNGLVKLGKMLLYYDTDSNVIDLTKGDLKGIKNIGMFSLRSCKNADTLYCDSDCVLGNDCFAVVSRSVSDLDPLPINSTHKIENIYIDGNKLTYQHLLEDAAAHEWVKKNFDQLIGSECIKIMTEEKTKDLLEQLDITYYGIKNDKAGTLSPTEEFYIRLKIHDYISQYDYDHNNDYKNFVSGFLLGGKMDCHEYADLTHYLLACSGVDCKSLHWDDDTSPNRHVWNSTVIDEEWFESDDGWDSQRNHTYGLFFISSSAMAKQSSHKYDFAYDSYHTYPNEEYRTDREIAERTLGDINSDGVRDQTDVDLLWAYVRDESDTIPGKPSDLNFDGNTDVTDALLLDQFVNGHALDTENIPIDGLSPGFTVYFIDNDDYDNIHSARTDRDGYITLPTDMFSAPAGKKLTFDIGKPGEKVKIHDPYQVINTKYLKPGDPGYDDDSSKKDDSSSKKDDSSSKTDDSSKPDKTGKLGDVNNDGKIDIEDAVTVIQHINGVRALTADEKTRANVSGDTKIDIDDAVMIISYVNGNKLF